MTLPAQRADVLAVFVGTGGVHPEDRANTEGVCMLLSDFPKRPGVEDVIALTQKEFAAALRQAKWGKQRCVYVPTGEEMGEVVYCKALTKEVINALREHVLPHKDVVVCFQVLYVFPKSFDDYPDPVGTLKKTVIDAEPDASSGSRTTNPLWLMHRQRRVYTTDVAASASAFLDALADSGLIVVKDNEPQPTDRVASAFSPGLDILTDTYRECNTVSMYGYADIRQRGLPKDAPFFFWGTDGRKLVKTAEEVREWAHRERKIFLKYLSKYRDHPAYTKVRTDLRAQFGSACEICSSMEKVSYCGRCGAIAYCSIEHQKQDFPRHKKECGASSSKIPI